MSFFSNLSIEVIEMFERGLTVNEISELLLLPVAIINDVIEAHKEYESCDFADEFDIISEELQ